MGWTYWFSGSESLKTAVLQQLRMAGMSLGSCGNAPTARLLIKAERAASVLARRTQFSQESYRKLIFISLTTMWHDNLIDRLGQYRDDWFRVQLQQHTHILKSSSEKVYSTRYGVCHNSSFPFFGSYQK